MEDVPHPCIFKGRCSHFERGVGHGRSTFILMAMADKCHEGTPGSSDLLRILSELSTYTVALS